MSTTDEGPVILHVTTNEDMRDAASRLERENVDELHLHHRDESLDDDIVAFLHLPHGHMLFDHDMVTAREVLLESMSANANRLEAFFLHTFDADGSFVRAYRPFLEDPRNTIRKISIEAVNPISHELARCILRSNGSIKSFAIKNYVDFPILNALLEKGIEDIRSFSITFDHTSFELLAVNTTLTQLIGVQVKPGQMCRLVDTLKGNSTLRSLSFHTNRWSENCFNDADYSSVAEFLHPDSAGLTTPRSRNRWWTDERPLFQGAFNRLLAPNRALHGYREMKQMLKLAEDAKVGVVCDAAAPRRPVKLISDGGYAVLLSRLAGKPEFLYRVLIDPSEYWLLEGRNSRPSIAPITTKRKEFPPIQCVESTECLTKKSMRSSHGTANAV